MRISSLHIAFFGAALASTVPAWAVYAPVPESEQGEEFTYAVRAGISYDSNIFGSASGAIGSTVYEVAPKIDFNASLTKETFASASYEAVIDEYQNRPGSKTLDSHYLTAKLAHSFSKTSQVFLTDAFSVVRNPASTLNGVPVNADQSYENNTADGKFSFAPSELITTTIKVQDTYYHYLSSVLSDTLDRNEDLFGLQGDYAMLPDLKAVAEYRHQDVDYVHNSGTDNKHTEFALTGVDYNPGPKTTVGVRVGAEYRNRDGAPNITTPYAELTAKYAYGEKSFVSAGYTYDLEEVSDTIHFTDSKVNRFFVNVQHAVTETFVASASIDYEPSILLGRSPQVNINEDTTRAGLALSYIPNKNWTFTASYDYDFVDSQLASRGLNRSRTGAFATYSF